MSTLKVTNIQATGETASRAVSGVAAAWAWVDQYADNAIDNSFNVASFTDLGTGNGTVNLSNATATNKQVSQLTSYRSGTMDISGNSGLSMTSTSSVRVIVKTSAGTADDAEYGMTLHGDLA